MSKQLSIKTKKIKYYGTVAISFTEPRTARSTIPLKSENRRQLICIIITKILHSLKFNEEKLKQIISLSNEKDTISSYEFGAVINQFIQYTEESNQLYKYYHITGYSCIGEHSIINFLQRVYLSHLPN
jgi:hypothetical protein